MRFYLTTHKRHWVRLTGEPLFLKSEHFAAARTLPQALGRSTDRRHQSEPAATDGLWAA